MKTEHLLVIRFSAMGDVAMMVPVIASLAAQYPQLHITVLSRPFARTLFNNIAQNVSFMEADVKKEYKGIHGLNALYRRLQAKHFTAVADMHDVLRTKYLRMRFNLDRYRVEHIDKHRKEKQLLCASDNKRLVQLPTSFDNYADVLRRLGYPIEFSFKSIFGNDKGDLSSLPITIAEKKAGERWIGIAPYAAHAGKIYPIDKMDNIIRTLATTHPDWRIFLFGGGSQEEDTTLKTWECDVPQCTFISRQLKGLGQELIVMSHLDLMLSMDSANMHLASLTGVPVISIWGATHPYAGFMGYGQNPDNAIQTSLPCRPCSIYGNKPCMRKDYACLNDIRPETVLEKIQLTIQNF